MAKPVLTPLSGHSEVDSGNAEESWRPEPNVATRQVPLKDSVSGTGGKEEGASSTLSSCLSSLPSSAA